MSVSVRKLQVVILARSSRKMSLTIRIVWQYIQSRVLVSVRPSNFFIREKLPKPRVHRVASSCVDLNGQRQASSQAERAVTVDWAPPYSDSMYGGEAATAVCVHLCALVCAHACARVRVCARACVMCLQYTITIFDPG